MEVIGRVKKRYVPRYSFRWKGYIDIETDVGEIRVILPGAMAQWLLEGSTVKVETDIIYPTLWRYRLWRLWGSEWVQVWPPFSKEIELSKKDPITGKTLYKYKIRVEEAVKEQDFERIVELEQYHYASKKETVAVWACPETGELIESNVRPECPGAKLVEIKGSLPVSRFLVLRLLEREPYEPEVVGYVRVDPPIPKMHRRLPDGRVQPNIRESVFPPDWFHPTYWPERLLRELRGAGTLDKRKAFTYVWRLAVEKCCTAAARISRVVVHPDYRGDGLGMLAARNAVDWISTRRIPEMKRSKHLVEVIAQMARYHPFFEKVGFKYLWDTKSGKPVLYYPLTEEAKEIIERFLQTDPVAKEHGGRLYREAYAPAEPINGPIILKDVVKYYESELDVDGLPEEIRDVLLAFGVARRKVQKYVLRGASAHINPGEVVAVVGASGAGKTTVLRIIAGIEKPDEGYVILPDNAKIAALIPWEREPEFGDETILEHMYEKLKDIVAAIEVLNISGLGDAIFYRARFSQLSTGQKERAKIASVLAERPNVLIIDEFAARLDPLTARRVARKVVQIARKFKMTAILVVHRPDVIDVINPDKIFYVGYGGIAERRARGDLNPGPSAPEADAISRLGHGPKLK